MSAFYPNPEYVNAAHRRVCECRVEAHYISFHEPTFYDDPDTSAMHIQCVGCGLVSCTLCAPHEEIGA
jgi:hypothetical protein